jgi:hypothetical protein
MNAARLREVARMAKRATPQKVHDLYMEVYGADFAGKVTIDIARRSIQVACAELLTKAGKEIKGFEMVAPAVPDETVTEEVKTETPVSREHVTRAKPGVRVRKYRTLEPL